jgi:hypothetical protein
MLGDYGVSARALYKNFPHSSWVATRRGLRKPVSSSPPFKTGLAAFTAPGLTPSILLRGSYSTMKHSFPFPSLHRTFSVVSLRIREVPLFRSFRRLGAFAFSPHPGVHGFPVLRLLRPIRHFLRHWGFVGVSLVGERKARYLTARLLTLPV